MGEVEVDKKAKGTERGGEEGKEQGSGGRKESRQYCNPSPWRTCRKMSARN